ncbi:MAG: polyprenyl synthetase family protein [Carnobacterium sp.]|uniref:polyprenyl synthetase family protein n=1 Tax=Carnobacterium sp. TaxID=48221 RepID=UPI003C785259
MAIHPIWSHYPEIEDELATSYAVIEKKVRIRNKEVEQVIFDLLYSGGKLLRPAYFILFSRFGDSDLKKTTQLTHAAASLEVLHMATLIHDDIIDDSPTRRGIETVQSKYGKDIAVYTGDFLFAVYFGLLAETTNSVSTIRLNAFVMRRILLGELDQMHLRYNTDITLRQYLRNITGKTAQLFSLSCLQGAQMGKADLKTITSSQHIGHNIGIAFQILDDILDYKQDSISLKKPVLEDMKQGVYSLPLILALRGHKKNFTPYLSKGQEMSDDDIQQVAHLVKKYNGIEEAQNLAERYTNKALTAIQQLPERPERDLLYDLTERLLNRKH